MTRYTPAGSQIAQYLRARSMKLTDLSAQTGISYSHIINIMRGTRDITQETFQKICKTLKLSREERYSLKEAVFVSNSTIVIQTANKKEGILHLLYWLTVKGNYMTKEEVDQCLALARNAQRRRDVQGEGNGSESFD